MTPNRLFLSPVFVCRTIGSLPVRGSVYRLPLASSWRCLRAPRFGSVGSIMSETGLMRWKHATLVNVSICPPPICHEAAWWVRRADASESGQSTGKAKGRGKVRTRARHEPCAPAFSTAWLHRHGGMLRCKKTHNSCIHSSTHCWQQWHGRGGAFTSYSNQDFVMPPCHVAAQ